MFNEGKYLIESRFQKKCANRVNVKKKKTKMISSTIYGGGSAMMVRGDSRKSPGLKNALINEQSSREIRNNSELTG